MSFNLKFSAKHGRNALQKRWSSSWLKKFNIQIFAGWEICTASPGWERIKVIPGNSLIREVLLEGGNG